MIKTVLSIAGSDCSGGAGIQADIKTITAHKMYAMTAITALTAQNTLGVSKIMQCSSSFVSAQLDSIFTDIPPDSVKTGMLPSPEIIDTVAASFTYYKAKNIVVDPVMVSTSGSCLISSDAVTALLDKLIPIADVITPNIPEAEILSGIKICNQDDMIAAAKEISKNISGAILIKGGHLICDATDLLYENGTAKWFFAPRINNPNTHGTGCTLSSAIACNMAKGLSIEESIRQAKNYLTKTISAMLDIGKGAGPLNHTCCLK